MSARRALRGFAVATLLAAATLSVTWGLLFYRPLPTTDGYYRLLSLEERGEVIRDVQGIPRIYAHGRHDLFFLQGYVTAQDRLTEMESLRVAARAAVGEAAELGVERATGALREALDAYAAGVTKLIRQHADARALPGELVVAGRRPAEWRPADTLAIAGLYLERILPTSVCASVAATMTLKGRPLLGADLYLDAPAPGWYEIGIDGAGIRAVGASLPGVPGIAAGHNGWIAWALLASARRASDPASTVGALLEAMTTRSSAAFAGAMRRSAVAACVADTRGTAGGTDRDLAAFVPADRPAVLGGDGGRGAELVGALDRARGVDLETMRGFLGRPTASVGARILIDLADVDTSRSASSHGISGQRASPHFGDQAPLWELGQVHRLPFSRPAIGRTDGQLVFRAR